MKASKPQLDKALKAPASVRLFLFYGPDEAGSRALAKRLAIAAGADAERIDLSGSDLKSDPARLTDEAAAISMFGSGRYVLVDPAGEDSLEAVTALLAADVTGNPVAMLAGALKATSKLLKACLADPSAVAFASYLPDARDWSRMVAEQARPFGLAARPDVAQRIAEAAAGNRALIDQELAKYALFLDAEPGQSVAIDFDAIEAVGAAHEEGDTSALIDHVFEGCSSGVQAELLRLRSEGVEGITLLRTALRRSLLLSRLRARVERGESGAAVMASQGKSLFWKEKDGIARQIEAWGAVRLQRCVRRLMEAEREVKRSGGLGPVAAEAELVMIARLAARR